jgi:enoyl-CoA hydratase/carnithine racemase
MIEEQAPAELLVREEGAICTLIINRPEKRNLLTASCLEEIFQVLTRLGSEDRIRAVILRGAGDQAFSSGYDISALPANPSPEVEAALRQKPPLERAIQALRAFPYPVIAMLNGHALGGGCELAVGCDLRIAARRVRMGMPPAKLGLVYPYPGLRRFLRVLGFSRTLELFLTGRTYDSEACFRMGLVHQVVEDRELEGVTYDLAREISENAPLSLRGNKQALYTIADYPLIEKEVEEGILSLFLRSLQSEDMAEGRRAFAEKRRPRFQGR